MVPSAETDGPGLTEKRRGPTQDAAVRSQLSPTEPMSDGGRGSEATLAPHGPMVREQTPACPPGKTDKLAAIPNPIRCMPSISC